MGRSYGLPFFLYIYVMALSWDEICDRGKQHNKTVICEVEKRNNVRSFKLRCNDCSDEKIARSDQFKNCNNCRIHNKKIDKEKFISNH